MNLTFTLVYGSINFHKITKIVRVLWLFAWEYVNTVVRSRYFAVHMLITQAWNWKRFWVENPTSLLYFPAVPRPLKLGKMLCQFFLNWNFKQEKSVFCKTRTDYAYKAHVQHFATDKNFSFNQCHKQRVLLYSWKSYFIIAILRQVKTWVKRLKRPPTENAKIFFNDVPQRYDKIYLTKIVLQNSSKLYMNY